MGANPKKTDSQHSLNLQARSHPLGEMFSVTSLGGKEKKPEWEKTKAEPSTRPVPGQDKRLDCLSESAGKKTISLA